jgi:hypothetical protein
VHETVGGGVTTRFLYDGADAIAEYNSSNTLLRRYVHGPGIDEPVVWYEGAGASDRRWLHQDRLGSVAAISNASGAALSINTYDEYGVPGSSNAGRPTCVAAEIGPPPIPGCERSEAVRDPQTRPFVILGPGLGLRPIRGWVLVL